MSENYELVNNGADKRMPNNNYKYSNRLENVINSLKQFGECFAFTAGYTMLVPYQIPTVIRETIEGVNALRSEPTQADSKLSIPATTGCILGLAYGIGMDTFVAVGYYVYFIKKGHAWVLAIPLGTNVGTGLREATRFAYYKWIKGRSETLDEIIEILRK